MNANDIILPGFQIEVTRRCNLNCIQCNRKKDRKEKVLTFSQFKKIVDAAMPIQKVQLLGGGEPFLNKDIKKMIDYCGEKKIHMGIVTNGTLLPDTVYPHVTYVLSIDHIIEE